MTDISIRDLTTIDEFRQVVALEKAIWGYTDEGDLVTVPVFIFTVHRGATLIGGAVDLRVAFGGVGHSGYQLCCVAAGARCPEGRRNPIIFHGRNFNRAAAQSGRAGRS